MLGGIVFFVIDRAVETHAGSAAQLMAMLLDFVPELLALGAAFATPERIGLVLALLIALQNLPEGFNAYRELTGPGRVRPARALGFFLVLVPFGPIAAWIGFQFLVSLPQVVGALMLFASGGILYLTFQDIAPQAKLERHWAPPIGAVVGFVVGLVAHLIITGEVAGP
jgi:ZIP family zinc transporter